MKNPSPSSRVNTETAKVLNLKLCSLRVTQKDQDLNCLHTKIHKIHLHKALTRPGLVSTVYSILHAASCKPLPSDRLVEGGLETNLAEHIFQEKWYILISYTEQTSLPALCLSLFFTITKLHPVHSTCKGNTFSHRGQGVPNNYGLLEEVFRDAIKQFVLNNSLLARSPFYSMTSLILKFFVKLRCLCLVGLSSQATNRL